MPRLLVAVALVALAPAAARAEIFGATFRSTTWGVEMTVPRGWELSEQASYPGLLARAFEHKGQARLSLAAQKLAPGEDDRAYVERNQKSLIKLGYRVVAMAPHGGAIVLETATPDGKTSVRQAFVVRGDSAYILTLAVSVAQTNAYIRPFDETLRGMVFSNPAPPPPAVTTPPEAPAQP